MKKTIAVIDFGGQYNQLICRRVREIGTHCIIVPHTAGAAEIHAQIPPGSSLIGIILTGGGDSVSAANAPELSECVIELGIPILGICYGAQALAYALGGVVEKAGRAEFGNTVCNVVSDVDGGLFRGVPQTFAVWQSHNDHIAKPPPGFVVTANTGSVAAIENGERRLYGLQFHPEVAHTEHGLTILQNFVNGICGGAGDWRMSSYMDEAIAAAGEQAGDGEVLLALSGGVDSSVAAGIISRAVGKQLTCVFVDHGLMRKDEGDEVFAAFRDFDLKFIRVNAGGRFLGKLAGVAEPELKRKIIGGEFIRVFEEEAVKLSAGNRGIEFLAQGTIYPDVVESGKGGVSQNIKSHHNVGGLPENIGFKGIIEPLRGLFKDEVRKLGRELGLPEYLVNRQPFPGPGLAIRIIGEVTAAKVAVLQQADRIFRDEVEAAAATGVMAALPSQYFAVLTDSRTVGVMGDGRTYDYVAALRAVTTDDFMTADYTKIPYDVLGRASSRIVNEVPHISRVCYDVTSKPPATIEWE